MNSCALACRPHPWPLTVRWPPPRRADFSDTRLFCASNPTSREAQMRTLNPKAVTIGQLYGEVDKATQVGGHCCPGCILDL